MPSSRRMMRTPAKSSSGGLPQQSEISSSKPVGAAVKPSTPPGGVAPAACTMVTTTGSVVSLAVMMIEVVSPSKITVPASFSPSSARVRPVPTGIPSIVPLPAAASNVCVTASMSAPLTSARTFTTPAGRWENPVPPGALMPLLERAAAGGPLAPAPSAAPMVGHSARAAMPPVPAGFCAQPAMRMAAARQNAQSGKTILFPDILFTYRWGWHEMASGYGWTPRLRRARPAGFWPGTVFAKPERPWYNQCGSAAKAWRKQTGRRNPTAGKKNRIHAQR